MRKTRLLLVLSAIMLGITFNAPPAQAQTVRAFVAGQGSDGNPCTFALPCRTFQKAHDTVAAGGEIDVLDTAGYGTLTISKSITIEGHGYAGVIAPSGATSKAIVITAGAGDSVTLRGLNIGGGGGALDGINSQSVGWLAVEDCEIHDFTGAGIFVTGNAGSFLLVSNTRVRNSNWGIYVWPSGPGATATLNRVELYHNNYGIFARSTNVDLNSGGGIIVAVKDSVVSYSSNGILAQGNAPPNCAFAQIHVSTSTVSKNFVGFATDKQCGFITISRSSVVNWPGPVFSNFDGSTGTICSTGDNLIRGAVGDSGYGTCIYQ